MAKQTRSAVFAIREETTEGTFIEVSSGTQFTVLREGFSFQGAVETVDSDELVNDIGMSESLVTREAPTASIPKYFKHSGTEGQAPDYGLMIKSAMGSVTSIATERTLTTGSTAGSSSAAPVLELAAGGSDYAEGRAVLIKDGTNGYAIRNVKPSGVSSNSLTLNYNLSGAPASGVTLGKAVHYSPAATGHPTYTAHLFQAGSSSAFRQSIAGCRTVGMQMEFPVNDLASISFDIEGIKYYLNPIVIDSTCNKIDGNIDGGGTDFSATLTSKAYKTPMDLAREVATKLTAAAGATISCSYSSITGKFTISKASGTLQLLWNTGTNTATTAATKLGFSSAADSTGALTYTSDNAQTYSPSVTPSFDSQGPTVVKYNELLIGDYSRNDNRQASNVSLTVSTPKTDVEDLTAESGVSESVVLEREVTFSATLVFKEHEVTELDNLLQNATTSIMFNHGPKSGGNWEAGKCVNVYMPNAKIQSNVISDQDGLVIVEVEAKGFVSSSAKDLHINFL
jgi:hypothetical protein